MYPPAASQGLLIRGIEGKEYLDLDEPSEVIDAQQLNVGIIISSSFHSQPSLVLMK